MTKEEKHLWYDFFKKTNYSVKRQHVIEDYIADFYIPEIKLAIELDGSQHYEPQNILKDNIRTETIEKYGITVVRIPNNAVNSRFREVCEYLNEMIAHYKLTR